MKYDHWKNISDIWLHTLCVVIPAFNIYIFLYSCCCWDPTSLNTIVWNISIYCFISFLFIHYFHIISFIIYFIFARLFIKNFFVFSHQRKRSVEFSAVRITCKLILFHLKKISMKHQIFNKWNGTKNEQ